MEANKVSCFKLIWRIVSGCSLWVDWIKQELLRKGSFWSIKETSASGSWMWRKLLKYRQQAREFCQVQVKSGMKISFWYDNWCCLGPLYLTLGNRGFIDLGITSNATLADALHRRRRHHRVDFLNKVEEELDRYRNRDLGVEQDVTLWRGLQNKFRPNFSTKDTWCQIRSAGLLQPWVKGVWFSNSTPKYSFFMWLATLNRLSTGDRMLAWNGGVNPSCVFCNDPWETRDHLFFSCVFSARIWENLSRRILGIHFTLAFEDILSLISGTVLKRTSRFIMRYAFQVTAYSIWCERNGRRHGALPRTSDDIIKNLDRTMRNRLCSLNSPRTSKLKDGLSIWFASRS